MKPEPSNLTPAAPACPPALARPATDIAVIGIGCRFPGKADDSHALWRNLLSGTDSIGEVPAQRWSADRHFHPKRGLPGKSASKWGGFLDEIDRFDAEFFGISPREAALMDPQQRLLLEVCWEALEDGGQLPGMLRNTPVGVFVGVFTLDYMLMQLGGTEYRAVEPHTATGSVMTMLANRLSYVFDFTRPQHGGRHRLLVVAGGGAPRLPEPGAAASRDTGAGRRRQLHARARADIGFSKRRHALARRPLQDLRRARRRLRARRRRRRGGAQARWPTRVADGDRDLRGDPRHRRQPGRPHAAA